MRPSSMSRAEGRTASGVTTRRERKARRLIVRSGSGEKIASSRTERRLISAGFQVSKIDNSSRKKCWVVVWRAYTCRLARASGRVCCGDFGVVREYACGIQNEWIGGDKI